MIGTEIMRLCFEGLHNNFDDKQWYLEEILKLVTTPKIYEDLKNDEKYGKWKESTEPTGELVSY